MNTIKSKGVNFRFNNLLISTISISYIDLKTAIRIRTHVAITVVQRPLPVFNSAN